MTENGRNPQAKKDLAGDTGPGVGSLGATKVFEEMETKLVGVVEARKKAKVQSKGKRKHGTFSQACVLGIDTTTNSTAC